MTPAKPNSNAKTDDVSKIKPQLDEEQDSHSVAVAAGGNQSVISPSADGAYQVPNLSLSFRNRRG